jgi:hypothetical protein
LSRAFLIGSFALLVCACGGGNKVIEDPNKGKKRVVAQVSPADLDDIKNHIGHLSNTNKRERWRNGLIALAKKARVVQRKIVEMLIGEYRNARSGNSRVLNDGGRERAIYVLAQIGEGEEVNAVVKEALTDSSPGVRVTAVEKYARDKDKSVLSDLLKEAAKPDPSTVDRVMTVFMVFASKENRAAFLDALTFANLDKMLPVVDKTISAQERASVLSQILSNHKRAPAVAYAVRSITADGKGEMLPAIQAAKKRLNNSQLDVEVYNSHGQFAKSESPPAGILSFYIEELKSESSNPKVAAENLTALGTVKAITALSDTALDSDTPQKSRQAIFHVLVSLAKKMKPSSQPSFQSKREAVLKALREGINLSGAIQKVSVEGLGIFAEASDANRLDRVLSNPSILKSCGPEVIKAMARLKGNRALSRLLGRLKSLASMRKEITAALSAKSSKLWDKNNLFKLVDYLRGPEVELRRAAQSILSKVTGESIRFDPNGDSAERKAAATKWAQYIQTRRS